MIDPAKVFYVGGSLGGIMGNTFMAYDPNITRGVLAVPGGVWSMLFERSNAWHLLMGAAQGSYEDPEVYQLNIAFLGMGMEPYDPITTAAHVIKDPLPGVPTKNILIWYAMGDCLVSNIATEMVARTMGIDLLGAGGEARCGACRPRPARWSTASTNYNEHPMPLPPDTNIPPATDNGTHSGVNRNPSALRAGRGVPPRQPAGHPDVRRRDAGGVRLRDRRLRLSTGTRKRTVVCCLRRRCRSKLMLRPVTASVHDGRDVADRRVVGSLWLRTETYFR